MSISSFEQDTFDHGISIASLKAMAPLGGSAVVSAGWTPANMAVPPEWFFDLDDADGSTLTLASPNSLFPATIVSKFNPAVIGTFGAACHLLPGNPYFGGRRSLAMRGSLAGSIVTMAGVQSMFKNIAGATLFWVGRHPTLVTDASPPPEGASYVYISTGAAGNSVRYQISGATTIKNSYRASGRRTDAAASAGSDMTGNVGTGVDLIWAEFDHTAARLRFYRNDSPLYDQPWLTAGVSDNTDSQFIGIGGYSAALTSMPPSEWMLAGAMPRIVSAEERQKFAGWALGRCGLAHQLPAGHPYRNAMP